MRVQLSDLLAGTDLRQAMRTPLTAQLSPFEAYLTLGMLVYQKTLNSEYLRTAAEENASKSAVASPLSPGLHVVTLNGRQLEFQQRISAVNNAWRSPSDVVNAISKMLEVSRNE